MKLKRRKIKSKEYILNNYDVSKNLLWTSINQL